MWQRVIPWQGRALAVLLLVSAGIAFGVAVGLAYESNRRDAQELAQQRDADKAFQAALASGKRHAANVIAWRGKARIYYRNWQERLKHEKDTNLAQCETQPGQQAQAGVHAVLLGPAWVGLYNDAWLPGFAEGDTGGVAYQIVGAGTATPREALDNVKLNAWLCGEDRKRLDELIDYLMETGAR